MTFLKALYYWLSAAGSATTAQFIMTIEHPSRLQLALLGFIVASILNFDPIKAGWNEYKKQKDLRDV